MKKIALCFLVVFFILASVQIYAQENLDESNQSRAVINEIQNKIQEIEQKLHNTENNNTNIIDDIKTLKQQMNILEKEISSTKMEVSAAEKLLEISDKNLVAPMYVFGIIIGVLALLAALYSVIGYIVRSSILKNIDDIAKRIEEAEKDHFSIIASDFSRKAYESWLREDYGEAIELGQKAVKYLEKYLGENPEDSEDKIRLYQNRGSLGYYYVEAQQTEKAGEAIQYAKMALEAGISSGNLNNIDNFLFIMMKFAKLKEDKKMWIDIYEVYKDDIFSSGIREVGDEQDEYKQYYRKIKKEVSKD